MRYNAFSSPPPSPLLSLSPSLSRVFLLGLKAVCECTCEDVEGVWIAQPLVKRERVADSGEDGRRTVIVVVTTSVVG